jgi:DNA-binding winged helix-turn-helix (wHTH) protein/pimeloyl-ACP methyl ester carboxylesterase
MIYTFEGYQLDTFRYELRHNDALVPVEPQVFDVLRHLIANRDRVVDKGELLDQVWGTRFVTESALTTRIKAARRAVGDDGSAQRVIKTVHGRGYRFAAEVTESDRPGHTGQHAAAQPVPLHLSQAVRFCRADDGVRLAYATAGVGPPLVKAANWLTHVRYDWESIVWGHWLRDLSQRNTLVHYDERGCGLSDWDAADVTFESWVRDLETVVDAMELDRFPLLAISQGAAVAATYAARHPDRVSHLVLYGSFPQGRDIRARTDSERRDAAFMLELLEAGWARVESPFGQMFASQFMPEGSSEQWSAFVELQERTTSAANARRLMQVSAGIDVTEVSAQIEAPTLVLHATGDLRVPVAQGELFASLIPGARFCPLDSVNHILLDREPAWSEFVREVTAFIASPG